MNANYGITVEVPDPQTSGGVYNLLPLKDAVLFPTAVFPIIVDRPASIRLIDDAVMSGGRLIAVTMLRSPSIIEPRYCDVHEVGVIARIHTMLREGDQEKVIIQGLHRVRFTECLSEDPYMRVRVEPMPDDPLPEKDTEAAALCRALEDAFRRAVRLSPAVPDAIADTVKDVGDPVRLADAVSLYTHMSGEENQVLLETTDTKKRLEILLESFTREILILETEKNIEARVNKRLEKSQREYYLREEMKVIRRELGEDEDRAAEKDELRKKIEDSEMTEEAKKSALNELRRLSTAAPSSPDYSVSRTYIETLLSLPWNTYTEDCLDMERVEKILDEDHYGLEKIKERIAEYLSVRQYTGGGDNMRHPILCFAGPPGVGKTSLGKSIARAMGRKFVRMSLGGIHDEAEIRGHRKTYVGALPGQIIQNIKRCGSHNPIFMLDEIDKVGSDHRGDPSSALLEVLDPEQNATFRDNYLEVAFDLSKVMFITTANVLSTIPAPLRDRMEIIQLSGYTEEEKTEIAMRHLVPKQLKEHGIEKGKLRFDRRSIREIIRGYTHEAGVRTLERRIAAVCRKVVRKYVKEEEAPKAITTKYVHEYLGAKRHREEDMKKRVKVPGVVPGLAWTSVGGEVLVVEACKVPGGGKLTLTGYLGEVMKESAQTALTYVKSRADKLGIDPDFFKENDIHLHAPEGAVPKDGPSAGITMMTALVSLATGRKMKPGVAMTGEITLTGNVLPIGGLKEKILGGKRAGIKTVIAPAPNKVDVEEDFPDGIDGIMNMVYVENADDVLKNALEK